MLAAKTAAADDYLDGEIDTLVYTALRFNGGGNLSSEGRS